jgi:hypothetical protein
LEGFDKDLFSKKEFENSIVLGTIFEKKTFNRFRVVFGFIG